ncbi:MAG: FAD:protein FMN transferase [Gammaproteobacteria bacterium]|nr:FAD:protein FMN transferase [Gammaproteobacteria bacterium]MDH4313046.1 FAD:protein FMN transferase [Gammaproteobacteria bacterium]MDH5273185.1 FAD:protein FMN transferase [Gammaproteobacteria bacterium]
MLVAVSACSRTMEPAQFAGPAMGTTYHVTVSGADSWQERRAVQSAIDRVLAETERHLSTYDETSEISLLNRDESRSWRDVSPTLFVVLREAREVSERTGGAFDVTVAPLLELWGYGPESAEVSGRTTFTPPTFDQLRQARESVGYARLELRQEPRRSVRKSASGMRLTVDGIAPGYAVDRIATEVRALGHQDFIVEIGGEVRAAGQRREGGPWRIAIEAPLATGREPLVGLRLHDAAVSTSGDYRDARIDTAGHSYSHTIDPRSGHTVAGALASVTVIDEKAIRADAYATALMVMGTEAGLAWAQALRVPALFVERTATPGEWRIVESPAFEEWRE